MDKIAIAAALVIALGGAPSAIHAQDVAEVTQAQVLAACATAGAPVDGCQATLTAYFAYLQSTGMAGAPLQQAVADLVVALAATPDASPVVVAAIEDIATNHATGEQAAAILQVARSMSTDDIRTGSILAPVPASPA